MNTNDNKKQDKVQSKTQTNKIKYRKILRIVQLELLEMLNFLWGTLEEFLLNNI